MLYRTAAYRRLLAASGLGLLCAWGSVAAQLPDVRWRIYGQYAADRDSGEQTEFDFDRIRVRAETVGERFGSVVQLELAADDWSRRRPRTTVDVIFDAYLNYRINDRYQLRAGQFKTPIGLDFSLPPNVMEITKRGMEFGLILNRASGVMLSGRQLGKRFGFDAGVFNLASRSGATAYEKGQAGDEYAFALRGHYALGDSDFQLAYGETGAAGGPGTADYRVTNLGWAFDRENVILKFEWMNGRGVRGNPTRRERVYYVHGAYRLRDDFELVVRHFDGNSRITGSATTLTNTYLGFTWHAFREERIQGRLQTNYVLAGGDEGAYTGLRGYRDDALLTQFQILFAALTSCR